MIPEVQQILTTGISVLTADGWRGRLHRVLLSPGHFRLNALIIRYGVFPARYVVVPVEQIADITDAHLQLRLSRAELAQLPTYQSAWLLPSEPIGPRRALVAVQYGSGGASERIIEVSPGAALAIAERHISPADGLIALRAGQPVRIGAHTVGQLVHLALDSRRRARQIVVRTSRLFGRQRIIPIEHVARCDAQGIWLTLDHATLDSLPEYRSDRSIAYDVRRALSDDEMIRRLDNRSIDVAVSAGVVVLRGHVTTVVSRARAERAARHVRGVLGVVNEIVVDGETQLAVAQALGHDKRTREHRLFVHVHRGVVLVSGEVDSQAVCAAIEAVAGCVPHVRAVINQASEPGDAGVAEGLRALFPRIGQEVYTNEARLGQVERVIIHPRHRRVIALVVRTWMAKRQQATTGVSLKPPPWRERLLVIPASVVQEVTETAVLLRIGNQAAMGCLDLDLAVYAPPQADWQPPYPYTHPDVLLESTRTREVPGASLVVPAISEGGIARVLGAAPNESKDVWETACYTV